SPSRLEQYSRCPFAHFVGYGLRPQEQRIYEMGGREIGDLYHTCLMEISRWLTDDGIPVNDRASRWMTVSKEECDKKIGSILSREALLYREGM
ncbi:PD-(D/E)XK nuclease family protein, partial [Pseudomonas aeruginosa]|nr:PD-(D/E)XK nuclease family protein [Pseudomonas aeruginosa]